MCGVLRVYLSLVCKLTHVSPEHGHLCGRQQFAVDIKTCHPDRGSCCSNPRCRSPASCWTQVPAAISGPTSCASLLFSPRPLWPALQGAQEWDPYFLSPLLFLGPALHSQQPWGCTPQSLALPCLSWCLACSSQGARGSVRNTFVVSETLGMSPNLLVPNQLC